MTVHDDFATLRRYLGEWDETTERYWHDHHNAVAALSRVEAEVARARAWHPLYIKAMEKLTAAEAEIARLRDGLRWVEEMTAGRAGVSGIADYIRALLADQDGAALLAEVHSDSWLAGDRGEA